MDLTIAISTCGARISNLRKWAFDERVHYLVIWQELSTTFCLEEFPPNVQVIVNNQVGVGYSRNIALKTCSTKWLWFMDDDVEIPVFSIDLLLKILLENPTSNTLILSVDFGPTIPQKAIIGTHTSVSKLFSVGTIQIVCCPALALKYNCFFPTNMGAGTIFPVCDEPVFLSRLRSKGGVRFTGVPEVFVYHPPVSSGMRFSGAGMLISRAMLFREVYGFPLCILASCWFLIKHIKIIGLDAIYLFSYRKPNN